MVFDHDDRKPYEFTWFLCCLILSLNSSPPGVFPIFDHAHIQSGRELSYTYDLGDPGVLMSDLYIFLSTSSRFLKLSYDFGPPCKSIGVTLVRHSTVGFERDGSKPHIFLHGFWAR